MVQVGEDAAKTKENVEELVQYLQLNLEDTLKNTIRLIGKPAAQKTVDSNQSSLDELPSAQVLGIFDSSKVATRAQNFKRFRQSTSNMIQKLFDSQLNSKKFIIRDLENQLLSQQQKSNTAVASRQRELEELKDMLERERATHEATKEELGKLKNTIVPQFQQLQDRLNDQEGHLRQKYQKEFRKKEEQLQSKLIKQKYRLQEEIEKSKMLDKQNTEHKIQMESLRYQI